MIDGRLAQKTDTLSGTRTLLTCDVFGRLLSQREYNTTNLYGIYVADINNINRMRVGLAPIGKDGHSIELHHWSGIANDFYDYSPVSWTEHRYIHYGIPMD